MPSKDLLEKYEYMTGEELGHRPSLYEKAEFAYSPLGMTLINNTKSKTNKNKMHNKNKQRKYLVYNTHSFKKFKYINEFEELSLDSMYRKLSEFKKRFNKVTIVNPLTD